MPTTHSMKPAPSYTNIAMRSDSGASSSAPSVKTSCDEDVKGESVFFIISISNEKIKINL